MVSYKKKTMKKKQRKGGDDQVTSDDKATSVVTQHDVKNSEIQATETEKYFGNETNDVEDKKFDLKASIKSDSVQS